ncbi:MAG: Gar1/Naf1 family protein [Candidatus Hadarchaeales archaeon]
MTYKFFGGKQVAVTGKILRATRRGIVARASGNTKLGQEVFDGKKKRIGNVSEIFGPVGSPYIVIKLASGLTPRDAERLVGSEIFMGEIERKTRKSR